jgi:hypothetical protein
MVRANRTLIVLKWFDSTEVDKFADWLTSELLKRYPPTGLDADPKKATRRLQKVHDNLFRRLEAFAREHTLNLYTRARLGNRVKWAMREAGYPPNFVEAFSHEVVTVISVVHARPRQASQKR